MTDDEIKARLKQLPDLPYDPNFDALFDAVVAPMVVSYVEDHDPGDEDAGEAPELRCQRLVLIAVPANTLVSR